MVNNLNVILPTWAGIKQETKEKEKKNRGELFLLGTNKTITSSASIPVYQLPFSGIEGMPISYHRLLLCLCSGSHHSSPLKTPLLKLSPFILHHQFLL